MLGKRKGILKFNSTLFLIAINVAIFLVSLIFIGIFGVSEFYSWVALNPNSIIHGENLWTLVSSIFIHADFAHLLFNMISLFFLGSLVERILGKRRYFLFFILSGIFAGLVFALLSGFLGFGIGEKIFGNPSIFGVGASGAIFALAGLLAVLIPKKKVYLIAGPLIAIIIQVLLESLFPDNPVLGAVNLITMIYIFFSIFAIFSFNPTLRRFAIPLEISFWMIPFVAIVPLIIVGLFISLPIGNTAHLGGFIAGAVYGFYLKKKYKNKTKFISEYFSR